MEVGVYLHNSVLWARFHPGLVNKSRLAKNRFLAQICSFTFPVLSLPSDMFCFFNKLVIIKDKTLVRRLSGMPGSM